ncbi:hypothetical protein HU17_00065 [Listeria monocytogenes]|nr:hypothetical protein [Listeria monocytogenes]
MSVEESNVVLKFKMDGQVQYATTIKQINQAMNIAAKEYKAHVAAMGNDASATDKLAAAKKKLETQLEGAQKRTQILREEYERMSKDTNVSTDALQKQYGKLLDAERAEASLSNQLEKTNEEMAKQESESMKNQKAMSVLKEEQSALEVESKKLTSEYELQKSALGENASESEKLSLEEKHLSEQMGLTEKQISNMEKQLKLVREEYGENSIEAQKMETELNEVKTSFNNLGHEMDTIGKKSNEAQTGMGKLTNILQSEALMNASDKLAGIGKKIFEIGRYSTEAFKEVHDGTATVIKKTGAHGEQLEKLITSYKNLGRDVPDDLTDVGAAIGEVNTQFKFMGEELERESDQLLQFATITDQDVTSATINAKQAIEAYKLTNEDLDMVLDSVAKTSQTTGQNTQDLFKKAIEGAPQIKALGLEFADGVELMGQFDQAGVDSSATLSSLSKASVTYAKDGKNLSDGLRETINKIKGAKDETEALNIASGVFGSKGAVRMVEAIKRGTFNLDQLGNSAQDASGTVSTTFNDAKSPMDEFDRTTNGVKLTMGEVGAKVVETLLPILDKMATALEVAGDWFKNLSPGMRDFIVVLGLVTGAVLTIIPVIAAIAVTVTVLDTALLPIIGVVLAIIAVITAIILVIKNWGSIVDWIKKKFDEFMLYVKLTWLAIKEFIIKPIVDTYKKVKKSVGEMITNLIEKFNQVKQSAQEKWNDVKRAVITPLANAYNRVKSIVSDLKSAIHEKFDAIKNSAKEKFEDAKKLITTPLDEAKGIIHRIIESIKEFFNFKISWPHIPLPHFGVRPKGWHIGDLLKGEIPSLDISWRAEGAIFRKPTIFGASGGRLQGAGDAGDEAALPLNEKTLGAIGRGIAATMGGGNTEIHLHVETLVADNMASIDRLNQRLQIGCMKSKNMLGQR